MALCDDWRFAMRDHIDRAKEMGFSGVAQGLASHYAGRLESVPQSFVLAAAATGKLIALGAGFGFVVAALGVVALGGAYFAEAINLAPVGVAIDWFSFG